MVGEAVEYCLSGAVEARIDGQPVALGGPKQRCVLAVLLANHGAVVSVDRLIDAVWDEHAPPKALASVRSYVANLRRLLNGSDPSRGQRLESRPHGYRLNLLPGDTVDLYRFESLVNAGRASLIRDDPGGSAATLGEALALWRGDPFGEFAYRDFAAPEVVRFAALRATAIEARLDAALQLGAGAEVVPDIEAAVARDPVQERLWGHLMLALHRSGRTADALRAFERARTVLLREIGSDPGEGLQTLRRKIGADAKGVRAQPIPTDDAGSDPASPLPFVGRDVEVRAVTAAVRRAHGGDGGLTLITGESGIGKTSLAVAVAHQARASGVVVAWAAHPPEVKLPLMWTWIQVLRQLGTELGASARAAVGDVNPGVVAALVPEWDGREGSAVVPATGFLLVEGIATALRELAARRPLLVVLDDLQLADEPSVTVLTLLAAHFPRPPIGIIGNWTYLGADRPVNRPSFDVARRSGDTTTVHLDGIEQQAAAQLIEAVAGKPLASTVSEPLWRQAEGNPFYVKEFARTLAAGYHGRQVPGDLPETVVGVVGRRLGGLDEPSRRVLSAAAVTGPDFDVADLADVMQLPVSAVQARLRPAYEAGLIDEVADRPGAYRFGHGLLRAGVLAQLPGPDRGSVHAAIALARGAALATVAYEDAIATADHAWRAGVDLAAGTALQMHETVIERALARSAYDDVADVAQHALQICDRLGSTPRDLERQATLWLHLAGAKGILEGQASTTAAAAAQRAFDIGAKVRGRSYYGAIALQCLLLCAHGRIGEAEVIGIGLRQAYERSGDPDVGVVADFVLVAVSALRGEVAQTLEVGRHMMATFPPPETVNDPMHFFHPRVYCWMALCQAIRGDRVAMLDYVREALQLAQSRGDVFNALAAKLVLVEAAAVLGDVEGTAAAAYAVEQQFNAAGGHQWGGAAKVIAVWADVLGGNGEPAAAFEAFEVLTADGSTAMNPFFLALLADIENHCGRTGHARELLGRAQHLADTTGEHAWDAFIGRRVAGVAPLRPDRPVGSRGLGQRRPLHHPAGHVAQHADSDSGERPQPADY